MAGRFARRKTIDTDIPTGPMSDISFLLVIFFMVTTVFVVYRGFPVDLPEAERVDLLESRLNAVNVWIGPQGRIMIDEYEADISSVAPIVSEKLAENPRVVVMIKSDRNTPYHVVSSVIQELKRANALRVSFVATKK